MGDEFYTAYIYNSLPVSLTVRRFPSGVHSLKLFSLKHMTLDTAFCMDVGQVKTGENGADTYIKMLQEVTRITAPIAHGIAHVYPSVQKLVAGFEKDGKDMLQSVRKSANRDGAFADREVGKRISRRLYNIFMGLDDGSTDI